jgi:hypothetical protein
VGPKFGLVAVKRENTLVVKKNPKFPEVKIIRAPYTLR